VAALYANENFPLQGVRALRDLGHDVLTTMETGKAGQAIPDSEVLALATESGRIVVTLNRRDFIRLHAHGPPHAGIIVCTQDPDPVAQATRIDAAIRTAGSMSGRLLRVNLPQPSQP
jgi:predicted nuclease of predicted toxin-antitoxin system